MNYHNIILFYLFFIIFIIYVIFLNKSEKIENFENDRDHIPIYVINLDQNKDRWGSITTEAKKQNINLKRFPAYFGKNLDEKKLIKDGILFKNHMLLKGQLGCAYSHYKLIKDKIEGKKQIILVLEDDIVIQKNFKNRLSEILSDLPEKWDLIFLGGCNVKGKLYKGKYIIPTHFNYSYNLCAHAYIINPKSVKKVLKTLKPFYRPIDSQWRDHFKDLNVYYVFPNFILQNKDLISTRREIDGLKQSNYWKKHHDQVSIQN